MAVNTTAALASIATKIKALEKKTIANVVEIGGLLHEASEKCEHGEYMKWLKTNFGWSHDTSSNYRAIYELSLNPNYSDFDKLDISITALYKVTGYIGTDDPDYEAAGKAVIEAARLGRVSCKMACKIIDDVLEKRLSPPPADPDPTTPAEPDPPADDDDDAEPADADDDPIRPPGARRVEYLWDTDHDVCCFAIRRLYEFRANDWAKVIEAVGSEMVREVASNLRDELDQYNQNKSIKAKADRAEAASRERVKV